MIGWSESALLSRMQTGWRGGRGDGTPCGSGSTLKATASIREALPALLDRYGVCSVCDAGAGDLHWVGQMAWSGVYQPFDLVPRSPAVTPLDITREALPSCDLILCRHVLIHLDPPRIERALSLFRLSARYLLASQYDGAGPFDPDEQFNPTDLRARLGEPLERIPDYGSELALWKL